MNNEQKDLATPHIALIALVDGLAKQKSIDRMVLNSSFLEEAKRHPEESLTAQMLQSLANLCLPARD